MANIVFDFLHNYETGERREPEPATAYQYDEGHVLEAVLPEVITSAEIHYWIRGMEEADAYTPTSITPNADGSCTVLGNIPNKYFETNGELRIYIVVTDGTASITTYEGKLHIAQRAMPDDYVDDDPENEATRILTEAQAAATTATQQAQAASASAGQAQQSAETLSGSVAQIATNTQDITALKEDILDITKMGLSVIEQTVSQDIISHRTGRVWKRKVWKYSVNQTADCPALDDYNEGVAVPFTDTAIGSDPYMDAYRVFRWMHCNYYREADGTARLITIEGYSDYAETGSVDVGTLLPTFWWAWDEYDDYWVLKFSDSPGEGLTPWKDAVRADGTILPYFIVSSYPSVLASDGKLRSQKGKPANNQSYNNIITNYQKKGEGYWGSGSSINTLAYIYLIVKYQTKLEQNKFATNCGFSISAPVVKAENGVKRVLVASTETRFAKGDGVTVGTTNNAYWLNGSLVPWAEVTSVEDVTVDGTAYKAIYLDVDSTFTTTTEMYVVGSACPSGQTDGVIGHYDGSIVSNTDSKHSIRIEGIELMNGLWFVLSDTVISFLNNYWQIYVAQKGTPHTANAHTGYKLIGESDAFTSDSYVGNVSFDVETGAMYHAEKGNSNANGNGAYHWNGGTDVADGTLREWRGWGYLGGGRAGCGLVACDGGSALSLAYASFGSRD